MLPFAKYSGAGNDFVIVDDRRLGTDPARAARRMCPRESGVGVDGLALVDPREGELGVRFFNPDGSEFGTCGNGSRCVARWAADRGLADGGRVRLRTSEGPIEADVEGDEVRLSYELPAAVESEHRLAGPEGERRCWLVGIGTPHLVVPVDAMPEGPIEPVCRPLRSHPELGPEGANVNLVELGGAERGRIRTYERGVERETLACGAGCMAATLALSSAGLAGPRLELETRSGEVITVVIAEGAPVSEGGEGSGGAQAGARAGGRLRIELAGPARPVFQGRFPGLGAGGEGDRDCGPGATGGAG